MLAPLTVIVVDVPEQMLALELVVRVGAVFTVIATVLLLVQPADDVPIMVYVVVDPGLAIDDVPVVLDNPTVGLQLYVLAPLTVIVVDEPEQMDVLELPLNVGIAFTVTATVFELVQPFDPVPVTV